MSRLWVPYLAGLQRRRPPQVTPPSSPGMQTVTFTEDTSTDFLNPDRGWMHRGNNTVIANARAGDADHAPGYSVVWTDVNSGSPFRLDAFQFSAISTTRLNEIAATFQAAEDAGVRLKTRFTYSYNPPPSNPDATQARIEGHLDQLAPVLDTWQHVIASVDAGFVGRWGEWNASGNGITDWTTAGANARRQIIDAILAAVPTTRMVAHRNPIHVRERFGESGYAMSLDDRFTGTPQSRLGWLNDSYVANQSHGGTYDTWSGHPQPDRYLLDRATFWHIGQYAVGTGESSDLGGLNEWNTSVAAIEEMAGSHIDTLFRKFYTPIIDRWISEGYYGEISRRLGYRLVMREAELPTQMVIGDPASIRVQISNVGFGKVYNPRAVDVVFVGAGGPFTARATADARRSLPLGGETVDVILEFTVPVGMTPTADYDVHLRWPDPSAAIEDDNRYAIRFANTGVWDAATGRHDLSASITAVAA